MKALELKIPPAVLVLLYGVAMWLASDYLPTLAVELPYREALTSAFVIAGGWFGVSGILAFRKARTTVNPEKPDTASVLVTNGVYRVSRNPMYFGLLLALLGWATYLSNILPFIGLPMFVAYMNRFQIHPEEQALSARFGAKYHDFLRSVRRWI